MIVPMAAYDAVNRSTQAASPDYWWILVMARAAGGGALGLRLAKFVAAALLPALTGSASSHHRRSERGASVPRQTLGPPIG